MNNLGLLSESRRENPVALSDVEKDKVYSFSNDKDYIKKVKVILKRKRGIEYFYDDLIKIIFKEDEKKSKSIIEDLRKYTGISFKAAQAEILSQEYVDKLISSQFKETIKKHYNMQDVLMYIDNLMYDLNKINNAKSRYLRFLISSFKQEIEEGKKAFVSDDFLMDIGDAYIPLIAVLYKINLKNSINPKYFTDLYHFEKQCEERLIAPPPTFTRGFFKPEKMVTFFLIIIFIVSIYFNLFY